MIEQLFSREYHPALKFLGGHEWLTFEIEEGRTLVKLQDIRLTRDDYRKFASDDMDKARYIVEHYCAGDPTTTLFTQTVARALADGPKIFCPAFDQCLALENTEANVTFDFYKQPFPTMIIELPKEYREHLKQEFNSREVPQYVLAYQHTNGMLALTAWINRDNVIVNCMSPSGRYESIEDAIVKNRRSDDLDFKIAEITQRLALNFSLMMTMLGVKIVGPLDQEAFKRNTRHAKGDDPKKAARARKFLESTVYLCEFQQQIKFYDVSHEGKGGTGEGTGQEHRSPKPHWRRGHFRQQAHGPQMTLRKLVFIKPVMVMSKFFAGDKSDTTVTYKAKEPGI
jgi:hypothetical protein